MALIDLDSFDHYATADLGKKTWTFAPGGNSALSTIQTGGRNSTNCLRVEQDKGASANANGVIRGHAALGTVFYGFAFKTDDNWTTSSGLGASASDAHTYCHWAIWTGNLQHLAMGPVATGAIYVYNVNGNSSSFLGQTAGGLISSSVWHYIEVKVVIHPTAGSVVIRVNGVEELNLTNVDTHNSSSVAGNYCDGIGFNSPYEGGTPAAAYAYFDDLYINDSTGSAPWNGFLGDIHVKALLPDADGTYTAWTPTGGGAHYTQVDDAYNALDTVTYVESSTSTQKDSYGFPALNIDSTTILGVQMNYLANKDDSGSTTINALSRISATDYTSSNLPVTTGQSYSRHIWQVSPATSTNWTESEIDGAEFGMQIT